MLSDRPRRILVVDDDVFIREISSAVLMAHGYEVDTAEDGEHGWSTLVEAKGSGSDGYDLLITDNKMPKLSGIGLIEKLRSVCMNLPVILASGDLPANLESLHLAAIMIKPFPPSVLLQTTKKVLQPDPPLVFPT
jgi:DNA-binding response OmpR family regulator